tara:strand:+ start:1185 stop:2465 length:1281 start_codon:yes stop_codon:yes gene_type:complete
MALNKYTRSSRFSPDTTDPDTGFRIADPSKMGKVNPQGNSMITSWPEFRKAYQRGELDPNLLTGAIGDVPQDIVKYMKGETNKLSERYAEPEYAINPDSQEVATYRSIGDPDFKTGDYYTKDDSLVGKKVQGFIQYDPENPENRSLVNRRRRENMPAYKLFGADMTPQDFIQVDTRASGMGSGSYSEEELAGLYPDLQVGGGVPMSNFGQSVYGESKAQRRKREDGKKRIQKLKEFEDEGIAPLSYRGKGRLGKRPRKRDIDIIRNEEYQDPKLELEGVPYEAPRSRNPRIKTYGNQKRKARQQRRQRKQDRKDVYARNRAKTKDFEQEGKLAKATYGRGLESMSAAELDDRKSMLKERKRDQMRGGNFFKNLAVNQGARQEIRDINRAKKFQGMSQRGEVDYFTPEQMKNYRDSNDNPLNRNRRS